MKIEKVAFEDYEKISELNKRNGLAILEKLDWYNLWKKNPYFCENKDWIIGWKLVNQNIIVGTCLNIPFIFEFNNKEFLAAVCSNYVIDKNYRSYALKLRHIYLSQEKIDLYLTNSANTKSEKIMEAFGAKKISQFDYRNRLVCILNKIQFFISIFKNLFFKNKKLYEENKFLEIDEDIKKKGEFTFSISREFDDEFLNFEKHLKKIKNFKSSKKLIWLKYKYDQYLKKRDILIVKIFKKKDLVGFIVMIKGREKKYNLKRLSITEIVILNDIDKILSEAIKFCKNVAKKINFDMIDVIGYKKSKREVLRKHGFFGKKSKNFNFLVKNNNPELNDELFFNQNELDLSLTDGDNIFYLN